MVDKPGPGAPSPLTKIPSMPLVSLLDVTARQPDTDMELVLVTTMQSRSSCFTLMYYAGRTKSPITHCSVNRKRFNSILLLVTYVPFTPTTTTTTTRRNWIVGDVNGALGLANGD